MDSKMNKKFLCASLILLTLGTSVWAKKKKQKVIEIAADAPKVENSEEATEAANQIRQPFSWESAGDVLKYEILIEKYDAQEKSWSQVFFHETNEEETQSCLIYIEPTLTPGNYRSTIKVYNILGILESDMTNREEFTVRKAFQPEIRSLSYTLNMGRTIYLDDLDNNGIIEIEGRNLFITDKSKDALKSTKYVLKSSKKTVEPVEILEHEANDRKVKFKFDMKELDVGKYNLVAKDLSGLHSEYNAASELVVKFKKWMDFDIEAGYTCPVVLHDSTIKEYLNTNVFPLSGQAKISIVPIKHNWGYLGIGVRADYSYFNMDNSSYKIDGNIINSHALLIYQLPIGKHRRLFLEAHGGAGITYFHNVKFHFDHGIESVPLNTISLSYDGGLAGMVYINKRLYIEAGGDFIFTQNKDMTMVSVLPYAGIGWQF